MNLSTWPIKSPCAVRTSFGHCLSVVFATMRTGKVDNLNFLLSGDNFFVSDVFIFLSD